MSARGGRAVLVDGARRGDRRARSRARWSRSGSPPASTWCPGVRSIYRWQGAVEEAAEVLLVVKTRADRARRLAARVRALHPYELPEVVALPVTDGSRRLPRLGGRGVAMSGAQMGLPEALERAAQALRRDADAIRPANGDPSRLAEGLGAAGRGARARLAARARARGRRGAGRRLGRGCRTARARRCWRSIRPRCRSRRARRCAASCTACARAASRCRRRLPPARGHAADARRRDRRGARRGLRPARRARRLARHRAPRRRRAPVPDRARRRARRARVRGARGRRAARCAASCATRRAAGRSRPRRCRRRRRARWWRAPPRDSRRRARCRAASSSGARAARTPPGAQTPGELAREALGAGSPTRPRRASRGGLRARGRSSARGRPSRARCRSSPCASAQAREGVLVVSEAARRDQVQRVLDEAPLELGAGDAGLVIALRLEETAYLWWQGGREDDARACLAAARPCASRASRVSRWRVPSSRPGSRPCCASRRSARRPSPSW